MSQYAHHIIWFYAKRFGYMSTKHRWAIWAYRGVQS